MDLNTQLHRVSAAQTQVSVLNKIVGLSSVADTRHVRMALKSQQGQELAVLTDISVPQDHLNVQMVVDC